MKLILALMSIVLTSNAADTIPLLDTNGKTSKIKWNIVNDTVMGGRSSSRWSKNSSALSFEGFLSLENNGGFASVRHDLDNINLSNTDGIFIKVKGDGRKYQFRIRSQASRWANYSQEFKTKKDTVQSFFLPYKDFKPSWRGRSVRNVPTLTGKDVRGIGFLLGDKVQGKFKLDILNISASTQKDFKNFLSKSKTSSSSKISKKDFDPMTINLVK
ncbi:MAG: CIA30 family protein [Verrucomicrobiales bacterium]|nr:CIA30 family protein [Verrucomicrobiales bacterium]